MITLRAPVPALALNLLALSLLAVTLAPAQAAAPSDEPALPAGNEYLADGGIRVAGAPGAAAALQALQQHAGAHPALTAELAGSDAAMPQLLFGNAPFILLDRPLTRIERVPYKKIHDAYPLSLRIARVADGQASGLTGAAALYVNAANPVQALTPEQFAAILTQGQPLGEISDWGQLTAQSGWAGQPLELTGPEPGDAELETLRDVYLDHRPASSRLQAEPDANARLRTVAANRNAIALAPSGLRMDGVREVQVLAAPGAQPFARYLYVHIRRDANGLPDATGAAFARAALSAAGAAALSAHAPGLAPLDRAEATAELAQLGSRTASAPLATPAPSRKPGYVQADGSIFIVGNDGMQDLLLALNARFIERHPGYAFKMRMEGSSTGGPALIAGVTPFAPLSRAMWDGDLQGFRQRYGYDPLDVRVGYTGHGPRATGKTPPALYVHRSNPLQALSLEQARRIYTQGAAPADLTTWAQLGLGGAWAHRTIHVYGLADDGGSATSARKLLLGGLAYTTRYETLGNVAHVVKAVASDPYGIGMTGWVDARAISPDVKVVPLTGDTSQPAVGPDYASVAAGRYPYSSHVRFYVNRPPGEPLPPFIKAYLEMVLSPEGQAIIAAQKDTEGGYVPLAPDQIAAELEKLR